MKRRISIVERNSMPLGGHERTQFRAIRQIVEGVELALITHTEQMATDSTEGLELHALLPPRRIRKNMSQSEVHQTEVAPISRYVGSLARDMRHLILVPSATHFDMQLLLALAKSDFASRVRLAGRILRMQTVASLSQNEIGELARFCQDKRLFLYTETTEMAAEIHSRFGVPVTGTMLLPCMVDPYQDDGAATTAPATKEAWSIAFLGNPREEKGSALHPQILSSLRRAVRQQSLPKPIRVHVQTFRLSKLRVPKAKHNLAMIKEAAMSRFPKSGLSVRLSYHSAPDNQFLAELHNADILVLPYLTPPYDTSGSGLILDGVLAGKTILHTSGMAMSAFLDCGNSESASSPEEFGSKLVKMLMHLDNYSFGKLEAKKRVLRALEATGAELRILI